MTCSGLDVDAVGSPVRLHDTAVGIASGDFGSPLWKGRLILNDGTQSNVSVDFCGTIHYHLKITHAYTILNTLNNYTINLLVSSGNIVD